MPVKIIKRGGIDVAEPAPVVEGGASADLAPTEEMTEEHRTWREYIPQHGSKPQPCPYCKHEYLKPCDEVAHKVCANFLFLQGEKRFLKP